MINGAGKCHTQVYAIGKDGAPFRSTSVLRTPATPDGVPLTA